VLLENVEDDKSLEIDVAKGVGNVVPKTTGTTE